MTENLKFKQAAEDYRQKVQLGEIEKPLPVDPITKARQNPRSLRMAINAKCFDCCCFQKTEVKYCTACDCHLHKLRPWQPSSKSPIRQQRIGKK